MNKRSRRKTGFLTKVLIGIFAVYATVTLLDLRMQINKQQEELALLASQTQNQEIVNSELQEAIDAAGDDEFYAQIARDKLGYVQRGERVFVDISSK